MTAQPVTEAQSRAQIETSTQPIIRRDELKGKNKLERATLVWSRYDYLIRLAAAQYNLDPNLIFAIIMFESGDDTFVIRDKLRLNDTSYSLGQILSGTARGIGYRGNLET